MIHAKLEHQYGRRWFAQGPASVCGYMLLDDRLYEGPALAERVASPTFQDRWVDTLKACDGFFGIVRQDNGTLWAAADRVRSIPLFYGHQGQDFFISDNADWVRRQVGDREMDPLAMAEFLQAAYVTGPDTLFPHVKQVQAGESITARLGPAGWTVEKTDYFLYRHGDFFTDPPEELTEKMDAVYQLSIERLVQRAHGRTIVIPLSGGWDSRLIALMLHRLKYKPVITFTIGTGEYVDVQRARKLAAELGFPWRHVLYNGERWRRWYPSPQRREYGRFAYNYVSLHHLLEWPGVWELHQEGYFPPDCIFVPGHTTTSSCLVPRSLAKGGRIGVNKVVKGIWDRKYEFQWGSGVGAEYRRQLEQRIRAVIAGLPTETPEEASDAFEYREWRERQSKFLVNAVRVYEFFGYGWDLPLWTLPSTDYWMHMPVALRYDRHFYKKYVAGLTGEVPPPGLSTASALRKAVKWCAFQVGLGKVARGLYNDYLRSKHPRGCLGGLPDSAWKQVRQEPFPEVTYWLNEALEEMRQMSQEP